MTALDNSQAGTADNGFDASMTFDGIAKGEDLSGWPEGAFSDKASSPRESYTSVLREYARFRSNKVLQNG